MLLLFFVAFVLPYRVLSQLEDRYIHGFHSNNLTTNGVAHVLPNGILKLTNDSNRVKGHAFHPSPFRFKTSPTDKASSFSTAFAFSTVPEFAKLGGHGFAFAISPSFQLSASLPSQYFGLFNKDNMGNFSNHIFAVEMDTVQDFEFGDISDNHIGVDLNSLYSNKSVNATYFLPNSSLAPINLKSGQIIQAWIDYDGAKNLLEVRLSPSSPRPDFPILSYDVDLSPILQELMYVGFSGSTGLLSSSHYIFGWSFTMNGTATSLSLSSLPSLPKPKKSRPELVTGLSVGFTALLFIAIGIAVFIAIKLKNADVVEPWELHAGPHRFTYKELKRATHGFSNKTLLGFGGFGKVHHGVLLGPHSNSEVAVKRISHESRQGLQEFVAEIASIGRLRHKNLVRLMGWCRRRGDLLLVYEYMPNGSLDKLLFDNPEITLDWKQRFNIIKGVAYGLLYLHEEWEQTVIHRDIKAGNVLLDSEHNGRLGDFGLAKLYEHGTNPSTTRVVGTLGYLAPELTRIGKPTTSSDVFAFGALLLEVACGRRPIEPKSSPDDLILVDWVWEKWKTGEVETAMDSRMGGDYDNEEALTVVKLGLMCMNNLPELRPGMRQVVKYLEGEVIEAEAVLPPNTFEERLSGLRGALSDVKFEDFVNSYQSSFLGAGRSTDGEGSLSTQMSLTYTNQCM